MLASLRTLGLIGLALVCTLEGCTETPPADLDAGDRPDAPIADAGDRPSDTGAPDSSPDAPAHDAGQDAGREPAPIFRNPVATADLELAREALRLLGSAAAGGSGSCSTCHGITRQRIRHWRALSDVAYRDCFSDLDPPTSEAARSVVLCFRGGASGAPFAAEHLGVFSSAARLPWMQWLFRQSNPGDAGAYDSFVDAAGMPPDPHRPFTQAEFDIVAEWFVRGVPEVDAVLPEDGAPTSCTPGVSSDVRTHVEAMRTSGWRAANESAAILMYGCAGGAGGLDCLASEPLASATSFGAGWDVVAGSRSRVLYTTTWNSSYWTRSSADGRFVAQGGGHPAGASVVDLAGDRHIGIRASYDPAFFPDNSGFMMLGGGGICEQRVLTAESLIEFTEPGCSAATMVGLYEHVGASLAGGDYWAIHGQFVSDDGGHWITPDDPDAGFASDSRTSLTRLINTGGGFMSVETLDVATPYEGDAVLSPSARLVATRVGDSLGRQVGFVLRRLEATRTGDTWTLEMPEIARYCIDGAKGAFSYDERWMVTHHYFGAGDDAEARELGFTGASDPRYATYGSQGAANVYLIDLLTGSATRITNMGPGQYALFPHFRSDGWIYFIVRTPGTGTEHIVASDAALRLE